MVFMVSSGNCFKALLGIESGPDTDLFFGIFAIVFRVMREFRFLAFRISAWIVALSWNRLSFMFAMIWDSWSGEHSGAFLYSYSGSLRRLTLVSRMVFVEENCGLF